MHIHYSELLLAGVWLCQLRWAWLLWMSPLSQSKSPCFIWLPLWSLGKRRKLVLIPNDSATSGLLFCNLALRKLFFLAHLSNLVHMQGSPTDLLEWIFQSSSQIRGMSSDHFHFQMEVWSSPMGFTLNAGIWMPSLGVQPYYNCLLRWTVRAGFFSPSGGVYRADAFI